MADFTDFSDGDRIRAAARPDVPAIPSDPEQREFSMRSGPAAQRALIVVYLVVLGAILWGVLSAFSH